MKQTKKAISTRIYEKRSPEKYFYVHDGSIIKSPFELANILENMDDLIYDFHTKDHGNDFVNWIRDVFHEEELAKKLENARSKQDIIRILEKNLSIESADRPKFNQEKVDRLKENKSVDIPEKKHVDNLEQIIKEFRESFQDMKKKVSDLRKNGRDTKIAELLLMRIPAHINLAEATGVKKDIDFVRSMLDKAGQEIEDIINTEDIEENNVAL